MTRTLSAELGTFTAAEKMLPIRRIRPATTRKYVVKQFDIAQAFVEQCSKNMPLDDVKRAFAKATQDLGFRYFACCSHVDPLNPPAEAVVFQSYPVEWVRYFSEGSLYMVDPVFRHAARTLLPFSWDDEHFRATLTPVQSGILRTAKEHGIEHGYTVPIHRPYATPASCSVVPDSAKIHPASCGAVHIMAAFMHEAVYRRLPRPISQGHSRLCLSNRERQCLELAAQGKSDWEIATIMGIAERTVHAHIEGAKRRLGVTTRVQAIVQSLFENQLSFTDVIKPPGTRNSYTVPMSSPPQPAPQ
jgi:DNA-binding CsgD family transcriptional regulator